MNWNEIIKNEQQKEYFIKLNKILQKEYKNKIIYPNKKNLYQAFSLCKYDKLKVVILGQDPYHGESQAQGLAFSTPKHIKNPPSMQNIIKEIRNDIGHCVCEEGDLSLWAEQGVLLINTVLSVENAKPKSHDKIGWQIFSNNIIEHINNNFTNIVFILWGASAIKKSKLINTSKHHIISSVHPSPLSSYRGFFGSKPFSKTNSILKSINKKEIIW